MPVPRAALISAVGVFNSRATASGSIKPFRCSNSSAMLIKSMVGSFFDSTSPISRLYL